MSESTPLDKTSELYTVFPFMEAFPFEGYEITLEADGSEPDETGISPLILKQFGAIGTENHLNFFYLDGETSMLVSFYQEDVQYIAETSGKIKKLTPVRDDLDSGLLSSSLKVKIDCVKRSKKFINLLKSEELSDAPFSEILKEVLDAHGAVLNSQQTLAVQKMNFKKIEETKLTSAERKAIGSFLDFQLNYAKIILGIVIAAKIY
jgi:hypothetical protein